MRQVHRQSTLKSEALFGGVALHDGQPVRCVLKPAPIGTGIVFVRTDVTDRDNRIESRADNVTDVNQCTTLGNAAGVTIATVEHLMAALAASGIDNLFVCVDSTELPALDGSSEPFLKLIEQVGIERQAAPRRYIQVIRPVEVKFGEASARIEPADQLELDVTIDFAEKAIGRQHIMLTPDVQTFRERLASARTFARAHEVAALHDAGLGLGGSLDNAVVVDGDKVLNPGGLRFADEFVRHKALDLLGDLYVGGPILGRVSTVKSGHGINHALLLALFADPKAWRFISLSSQAEVNRITTSSGALSQLVEVGA